MIESLEGRPLSIALFSDSAFPIRNGVSVSIDALVKRLRELGHSTHLFAPRFPGFVDQDPNIRRLRSVMTPFAGGTPFAWPFLTGEVRFKHEQFDVVHVHTPWIAGMLGIRWAHQADIPVIATYHTQYDRYIHYVPVAPDKLKRAVTVYHIRRLLNSCAQVIVPSPSALRWLRRMGVKAPTSVIPTGVPSPKRFVQFSERDRLGARPGQTIVLTCGRLAPEKNLGTLISAFSHAVKLDPSLVLWIVGDGPARGEITTQVRSHGIGDNVRFFGSVERSQVDRFYAAADIFVFTSVTETQGLVVLEAMSYGLPVVVCRGGGASTPIVEGVNGLKVRTDPSAIAEALLRVAHDEGLASKLCDGAKESAQKATIEVMADDTVQIYREAIGAASAARPASPAKSC